jgi:hypothetical protein
LKQVAPGSVGEFVVGEQEVECLFGQLFPSLPEIGCRRYLETLSLQKLQQLASAVRRLDQ